MMGSFRLTIPLFCYYYAFSTDGRTGWRRLLFFSFMYHIIHIWDNWR